MPAFAPFEPGVRPVPDAAAPRVAIRPALPGDAAGVVRVAATRGPQRADLETRVAGWAVDPDRCVLVAVPDGAPAVVGWAMASRWAHDDAPPGYVVSALTVDPGWWRRGLGHRLASGLLAWAWDRADVLHSLVNLRNEASLALHARLGFVEVRRGAELAGVPFDGGAGVMLRASRPPRPTPPGPTTQEQHP